MEDDIKIEDPSLTQIGAVDFFSNLYHQLPQQSDEDLFKVVGPSVSAEQNAQLTTIPTDLEIKNTIFSMKRSSSPGLDGFTGAFFTCAWSL